MSENKLDIQYRAADHKPIDGLNKAVLNTKEANGDQSKALFYYVEVDGRKIYVEANTENVTAMFGINGMKVYTISIQAARRLIWFFVKWWIFTCWFGLRCRLINRVIAKEIEKRG